MSASATSHPRCPHFVSDYRLHRVDLIDFCRWPPREQSEGHLFWRDIDDGKPVLFHRRQRLSHIYSPRGRILDFTERGREWEVTGPECAHQDNFDWIALEVEVARPAHCSHA